MSTTTTKATTAKTTTAKTTKNLPAVQNIKASPRTIDLKKVTVDTLVQTGIVPIMTDDNGKPIPPDFGAMAINARKAHSTNALMQNTGSVSDAMAILMDTVGVEMANAARSGRTIALALAIVDKTEEYTHITNPETKKAFKSTSALFRHIYPDLADSTIRNYLNAGRAIYLPALTGELDTNLRVLDTLEPGTALNVTGALNDETVKPHLAAAIKEATNSGALKLSAPRLKEAVKKAKEKAGLKVTRNDNGTKGSDKNDAKAAKAINKEAWKQLIHKGIRIEIDGKERHMDILERDLSDAKELLKAASKDEKSALDFVDALIEILNI